MGDARRAGRWRAGRARARSRDLRAGWEPLDSRELLAITGLDPSFGAGGLALRDFTASSNGRVDPEGITASVRQDDGKVVAVGYGQVGINTGIYVLRFDTDGTPDPTFGTAGVATASLSALAGATSVAMTPGGQIVVGGYSDPSGQGGRSAFAVVRFNTDGKLDGTFGTGGIVTTPFAGLSSAAQGVAVQPDGKIVAVGAEATTVGLAGDNPGGMSGDAGFAVVRYDGDGGLDASFGAGGRVVSPFLGSGGTDPTAVALEPDGSIVAAGLGYFGGLGGVVAARYTPSGAFDVSFNGAGAIFVPTFGATNTAPIAGLGNARGAVALQPDGRIVATDGVGVESVKAGANLVALPIPSVVRFAANGTLDPTFADRGLATVAAGFNGGIDPDALAIQANGDILAGGPFDAGAAGGSIASGDSVGLFRLDSNGAADPGFGVGGSIVTPLASQVSGPSPSVVGVYPLADGRVLASVQGVDPKVPADLEIGLARYGTLPITAPYEPPGDFDNLGKTDLAVYLPQFGEFAIRPNNGGPNLLLPFGIPGAGNTIPVVGDYDGSGVAELAVYFPKTGYFAYRPARGGPDVFVQFGIPGGSIPVPADYDGSGHDEFGVYLPSIGAFAYRPANGGPDVLTRFGPAGAGASIPVPADYDGSGHAELAVYMPSTGTFAYRPAGGGPDVFARFGIPGAGASIPVPADYDGSGHAELAVYLTATGSFAYRPAKGGPDVIAQFGLPGPGASIPAVGDYDGSGHAEFAVYLPGPGAFAYRPAKGGADKILFFGIPGPGNSVPATGPTA